MDGAINRRWIAIRLLAAALVIAVISSAACVFLAVNTALEAERNLHAAHCVLKVLESYVDTHEGRWPVSWDSLSTVSVIKSGMFAWPVDVDDLRSRVEIHFDVQGAAVATGSTPVVSTIKVATPYYEMHEEDFRGLLDALRRHHKEGTEVSLGDVPPSDR